jgi:hypothetical protein
MFAVDDGRSVDVFAPLRSCIRFDCDSAASHNIRNASRSDVKQRNEGKDVFMELSFCSLRIDHEGNYPPCTVNAADGDTGTLRVSDHMCNTTNLYVLCTGSFVVVYVD